MHISRRTCLAIALYLRRAQRSLPHTSQRSKVMETCRYQMDCSRQFMHSPSYSPFVCSIMSTLQSNAACPAAAPPLPCPLL